MSRYMLPFLSLVGLFGFGAAEPSPTESPLDGPSRHPPVPTPPPPLRPPAGAGRAPLPRRPLPPVPPMLPPPPEPRPSPQVHRGLAGPLPKWVRRLTPKARHLWCRKAALYGAQDATAILRRRQKKERGLHG